MEMRLREFFPDWQTAQSSIFDLANGKSISKQELFAESLVRAKALALQWGENRNAFMLVNESPIDFIIDFLSVIISENLVVPVIKEWPQDTRRSIEDRLLPVAEISQGSIRRFEREKYTTFEVGEHVILHSSGTTSTPKSILHSIHSLVENAGSLAKHLKVSAEDRHLCVLNLAHAHALGFGMLSSLVLDYDLYMSNFMTPNKWIKELSANRITITSLVPPMANLIAASGKRFEVSSYQSLRFVLISSSKLTMESAQDFLASVSVPIAHGWGQSELSNFVTCTPPISDLTNYIQDATLSIGSPLPGCDVSLSEDEIVVKSAYAAKRIWSDKSVSVLADFHPTGDLGFWFNQSLFITSRKDEAIVKGAIKYSPTYIENRVRALEFVENVVAFKIETSSGDDQLGLFVVSRTSGDQHNLSAQIKSKLADFILVDHIVFGEQSDIPMTQTGKVQRRKMVEMA